MSDVTRREAVGLLALLPLASALGCDRVATERAARHAEQAVAAKGAGRAAAPQFFTAHEWETVHVLADLIIPRDERSGSATDAGVPEFIDFMMIDRPHEQTAMRGGLAWLDAECERRFGKPFVACATAEQTSLLDDIAWPARAKPGLGHGVAFFTRFRDLTAFGFWSSRMGIADLQYEGNRFVPAWTGCPEAAMRKLGVQDT
ncbi:MAG: gluconate 2-dehydrogenase subunit 3 family protein [Gemmatimonadaceae bacterium]|nr:gluconate 2-dehydrogenase subunit 3 family protein [Gemmatimonadaceae bacterium]